MISKVLHSQSIHLRYFTDSSSQLETEALAVVVEERVVTVGKAGTLFIWTILLYIKALKVRIKYFT